MKFVLALVAAAAVSTAPAQKDAAAAVHQLDRDSAGVAKLMRAAASLPGKAPAVLALPVASATITKGFGPMLHPILKRSVQHNGIDFRAALNTPVTAAAAGQVVYAGWYGGYGKTVIIDHPGALATLYCHLDSYVVAAGQKVQAGTSIGFSGSTGMSTGPHLHFELRRDGVAIDPAPYFARSAAKASKASS